LEDAIMPVIRPIPAFSDNYIWLLYDESSRQAWVVDPGDAEPVLKTLDALELTLEGVLITHHHFDHTGGLPQLCDAFSPVVYGPTNPATAEITRRLSAGDRASALGLDFEVLEVPGHTLDHIAYFAAGDTPLLFCGDTLFAGGCGRVFEGTPGMMHASLQRLAGLPPATRVYCAHEYTLANLAFARAVEPDNEALARRVEEAEATRARGEPTVPSNLALELDTNPFLRCTQPALIESLKRQGRLEHDGAVEVFSTVRGWKDSF
jgi:hydroxyacylglutathione hydrolase